MHSNTRRQAHRAPGRVTSLVLGRQLTYARALMKIDERGEQIDLEVHG